MKDSRSSRPKKAGAGASKKVAHTPILLKGGRVLDPSSDLDGVRDVLIEKGLISKISKTVTSKRARAIDVTGKLIVPGLIDMHTHLREPGREDEETIESGTRAAVKGGFSTVCCMPNTEPPIDDQGTVRFILERAEDRGKCSVHPIGAITKGRQGKELCEIGDLVMAGCVAISDDGSPVMNGEIMRRALEYTRRFDIPVISHCEDTDMTRGWQMNEGFSSTRLGLKGYPPVAEEIMVARDIALCRYTGGRLHIAHLSTKGSLELVRKAKMEGAPVTCEVTPHHITLTDDLISSFDSNFKVNPPLRTEEDVEALIGGILDGTVDAIATDHAPHAFFEKEVEFTAAPFGMTGLETAVGLVLTELVKKRSIPLARVFACMGFNPVRILNVKGGTLKPGSPADIAIIDLDKAWTVEEGQFESKSRNSPFIGRQLEGQVCLTLVGGRIAYEDGALHD